MTTENKTKKFFITGTDTNIGKTTATIALIKYIQQKNLTALGLKPFATGCFIKNQKLYNDDALLLQQTSNLNPKYEHINPYNFIPPVSPHIVNINNVIKARDIITACNNSIDFYKPDYCFIEGAGGFLCPLNIEETFANIALNLNIPVILVVGIKLGCLNHAILTTESILSKNLPLHGWIANCLSPDDVYAQQNIDYLKSKIPAPLLGTIDFMSDINDATIKINAPFLV